MVTSNYLNSIIGTLLKPGDNNSLESTIKCVFKKKYIPTFTQGLILIVSF